MFYHEPGAGYVCCADDAVYSAAISNVDNQTVTSKPQEASVFKDVFKEYYDMDESVQKSVLYKSMPEADKAAVNTTAPGLVNANAAVEDASAAAAPSVITDISPLGELIATVKETRSANTISVTPQGQESDTKMDVVSAAPATEDTKISINFRNIDIIEALKFFSMKARMNIIPTQRVSGRVTLTVDNVPIKDVLDIMLRSNNLAYDKRGEIYNVMTEAEYRVLYGKSFGDTRQVKVFHLSYAIPEQAFAFWIR